MAKLTEFGFICGDFSVALSGNDIILPGSKNQPLKRSLLPIPDMNDAAGMYKLTVTSNGSILCTMPVHVLWLGHVTQKEPFLGLKCETKFIETLRQYQGKSVELKFTLIAQTAADAPLSPESTVH